MSRANLSCYKASCAGEFIYQGERDEDTLYQCESCGAELGQSGIEELAESEGPVGQLARVLLNGGSQ